MAQQSRFEKNEDAGPARREAPPNLEASRDPMGMAKTEKMASERTEVTVERAPLDDGGERYELRAMLGEGGMGEVRLCRDRRIGRDVAMKVIRRGAGSASDARARFEREARVQGQLEHPAVVPVYDLGLGGGGEAFFTMKRV